jgi:hypothetical protein
MKFTTIVTLLAICGSSAWAQNTAPAAPPASSSGAKTADANPEKTSGTVQAQIEAAIKAYQAQSNAFMEKLRAEKDRAKRREMFKSRPDPSSVVNMILKFARDDPKARGIDKGLAWALRGANPDQKKEIATLLLTHHKDSKAIGALVASYARSRKGTEEGLREIIEKAGDEGVRQVATYYLASKLIKNPGSKAEGIAMMKKLAEWPGIGESNPKLLTAVKGELFARENLSVGSKAPDIVGTDCDGKEFKLSDYKGKVVLLDFWGFW